MSKDFLNPVNLFLACVCGAVASVNAFSQMVYTNGFETGADSHWSIANTDTTPLGGRRFLGQFTNQTVTLNLKNVPPHNTVIVSFDLFIIRSWDGSDEATAGPDIWELRVAGGPTLLHTTFGIHNASYRRFQAYPDSYPGGNHPVTSGAKEVNTLGYFFAFNDRYASGGTLPLDSVYQLKYSFEHSASSLELVFSGIGLQPVEDESWGLDNVVVSVANIFSEMPPEIVAQPQNQLVVPGGDAVYKVVALGTPPLQYQWRRNGEPISKATDSLLVVTNVMPGEEAIYTVEISNDVGSVSSAMATLTMRTISDFIPPPWDEQDIGDPWFFGYERYSSGVFTITGGGADIWDLQDQFHFFYQRLLGDGQIVARVLRLDNTDPWAKAGVMLREKLSADSKHAMMNVTPGHGTSFQRRLSTGGLSAHTTPEDAMAPPCWVKLVRNGSIVTGSRSADGVNWIGVGSDTIPMQKVVFVGLAVTAHNSNAWTTATFDNVQVSSLNSASIFNVRASQHPSTTLVDVFYDLGGAGTAYTVSVAVSTDGGATLSVPATHFTGDGVSSPTAPGAGKHIVWDAGADLGPGYFPNVVLRVSADGPFTTSNIFPVNLRGLDGGLKVTGQVVDGATGKAVADALVQLDSHAATSDVQGRFNFPSVAVGDYTLSVSKSGYAAASAVVSVTPGSAPSRVITLYPASSPGSAPRVTAVTSKYPGAVCFLDKVLFPVKFAATVDWAGHPPGTVQFITPRTTYAVSASGGTATKTLDMGSDFGPNGRLRVLAVSSDGAGSPEFTSKWVVAPNPFPVFLAPTWGVEDQGSTFSYNTSMETTVLDAGVEPGNIPSTIPVFGGQALKLGFIPSMECTVNSDGTAELAMKWEDLEAGQLLEAQRKNHGLKNALSLLTDFADQGRIDRRRMPHTWFGGVDLTLYPELGGGWKYSASAGQWQPNGAYAGLGADLSVSHTWPFVLGYVPVYAKLQAALNAEATVTLLGLSPLDLAGELDVNPNLRGSLGVGISDLLAAEGWVEGGANIDLQWPEPPNSQPASLYVKAGATLYYLIGHKDYSGLFWSWPSEGVLHSRQVVLHETPWQPLGREYLQQPSQGILARLARVRRMDSRSGDSPDILLSPVFPYSDPNCFARGTNLNLVFVADNTNRTSMNRTMALCTQFDGTNWSQPTPIADDGTADFHPRLLNFPDGTMVVAWENEGAPLPDTATLDDMKANLEVSVAWFDPKTGGWSPAWQATTNGFLDRSPKLAGQSQDNVLLTWIANPANDESGSPTAPDQIWSARWNGNAWSAPQLVATITNAVLKYDLAYDGTTANLVLSVDTVSGAMDVNGHELFYMAYQNGTWGPPRRLTTDQVPDDNPQMTLDSQGKVVLTWLKGDELSSVVDFAMTNRQVLRSNEYSSNLADFKLAASAGGRLALLWAEPSENDSDLFAMFYDPTAQVWGAPKQLTHDPETERGMTAAFFGAKELVAIYNRTLVSSTNAPGTSVTDLAALVSPLGEDLALDGSLFYSDPANPSPGGSATLHLRVLNLGDQAETDVVVAFYQGAVGPESELGRASLTNSLPPQAASEVTFTFPVAATNGTTTVFAVVDPDQKVADVTLSNNVARLDLVKPNLGIQSVSWSLVASNLVAVTVRVGNDGAVDTEPATVSLRQDSATGANLFSQDLPTLAPGESKDVSFVWGVAGLPHDLNVVAVLSGSGLANNFSTAKLTADLAIDLTTPPRLEDCHYLADGSFQMTILSEPGRSYAVQSSTNLIDWLPVTTFVSTNATTTVVDPTADESPYRFYRAVWP